jgi:hypothetical protein
MSTKQQQLLSTKAKKNGYKMCHPRHQCYHNNPVWPVLTMPVIHFLCGHTAVLMQAETHITYLTL